MPFQPPYQQNRCTGGKSTDIQKKIKTHNDLVQSRATNFWDREMLNSLYNQLFGTNTKFVICITNLLHKVNKTSRADKMTLEINKYAIKVWNVNNFALQFYDQWCFCGLHSYAYL